MSEVVSAASFRRYDFYCLSLGGERTSMQSQLFYDVVAHYARLINVLLLPSAPPTLKLLPFKTPTI